MRSWRSLATAVLALTFAITSCTAPDRETQAPALQSGGSGGQAGGGGSPAIAGIGGAPPSLDAAVAGPNAAGTSAPPPTGGSTADSSVAPIDASTELDASTPITCPSPALSPGDHEGSVVHDGRDRTYLMHVPASYTGEEPVPIVFDFHGYGSSGRGQMGASGFAELSDQHGFIAVYPDGVGGSWHVNGCCGQAAQANLDEIAAVRAIMADVIAQVCVDPRRVYASGISQGGGMAHHVGCLAADVFAAIAPVSSDLRTEPCTPSRKISELSFRGTADTLSAYEGGPVGPIGMQYQSIGARETLEAWRMIDECTGAAETELELCETYKECAAGVEVGLCTLPGAGHILYTNPSGFAVAAAAWAMFERQTL